MGAATLASGRKANMQSSGFQAFIRSNWRFLGFGFALTFTCNLGQTFFIGLYNAPIREAFGLSNGDFGALYGVATLSSAGALVWIGRLVDRVDLRHYTLAVIIGMAGACLLMAVGGGLPVLWLGLVLLRLCGQGLMPHISNTGMGRYFEAARGRAVSISQLGLSAGQILLPLIATGLMAAVGWRASWGLYAVLLVVGLIPLIRLLLKDHPERHRRWLAEMTVSEAQSGEHSRMKSPLRDGLFRDRRFFVILPALLSGGLFGTSVFFFQAQLMAEKGWPVGLYAFSFPFFALAMTAASLAGGFILDRIGGSLKLLPAALVPYIAALVALAFVQRSFWFPVTMVLIGASTGLLSVIGGTLWPELYGTRMLGAVRAFVTSVMVLATAVMPFGIGKLYDAGVSVRASYIGFAAYMVFFGVLLIPIAYRSRVDNR